MLEWESFSNLGQLPHDAVVQSYLITTLFHFQRTHPPQGGRFHQGFLWPPTKPPPVEACINNNRGRHNGQKTGGRQKRAAIFTASLLTKLNFPTQAESRERERERVGDKHTVQTRIHYYCVTLRARHTRAAPRFAIS